MTISGRGVKDGAGVDRRGVSPLAGTRGVREVGTAGDGDGIRKADGGAMLPIELSPAQGAGLRSGLVILSLSWQSTVGCACGHGCRGGSGTPRESGPW
jgi:hypothetical protein